MATAVHLSTNSSEITVVSNLNKAYSSEGVPTLNVASKFEFLKSLWNKILIIFIFCVQYMYILVYNHKVTERQCSELVSHVPAYETTTLTYIELEHTQCSTTSLRNYRLCKRDWKLLT